MASTDPLTGATIVDQGDAATSGFQIGRLLTETRSMMVPRFPSISARNAAYAAAGITPVAGMTCAVAGVLHTHDGTDWRWMRRGYDGAATTNASGLYTWTHNLGAAMTGAVFTLGPLATDLLMNVADFKLAASDSTTATGYLSRNDTNVALPNQAFRFSYIGFH